MTTKIEITDDMVERFVLFLRRERGAESSGDHRGISFDVAKATLQEIISPAPTIGELISNVVTCKNELVRMRDTYITFTQPGERREYHRQQYDRAHAEFTEALNAVRDRLIQLSGEKE